MSAANAIGVNPAARRSPIRFMEIMPSGRTGTVPESVASFHTVICSESSAPITYRFGSIGPPVLMAELEFCVVGCWAAAGCWTGTVASDVVAGGVDGGGAVVLGAWAKHMAGMVMSITVNLEQNCFMR